MAYKWMAWCRIDDGGVNDPRAALGKTWAGFVISVACFPVATRSRSGGSELDIIVMRPSVHMMGRPCGLPVLVGNEVSQP